MMDRLDNKRVLVTGAGSGIGRATVARVVAEGGRVFAVDLDAAALAETRESLGDLAGRAITHSCNIADPLAVADCLRLCLEALEGLDALVHMAGVLRFDDTGGLPLGDWQRVLDINLTGTFLICQAALPHLVESQGAIVNAASTAALAGLPCGAAYAASKGGVLAFTRSIAVEYAKRGVRANCVCPGDIGTNMTADVSFPPSMDFKLMPRISSLTGPRGPEVVAGVIAMLVSDDGIHITGEDIRVDGGTLS
jgi:NAD(P)-dependent dehydrogenase (short-subunit alcohol dehydrogenase family)